MLKISLVDLLQSKIAKFAFIGILGNLFALLIITISVEIFHFHYLVGVVLGFIGGVSINFGFNRKYTFTNFDEGKGLTRQILEYYVSNLISLFLNMGIISVLVEIFSVHYLISSILAILSSFLINFLISNNIVFAK